MRLARLGRKIPLVVRKKISRSHMGMKLSEETKEKISSTFFPKGHKPWNKDMKNPYGGEESHPGWKGDEVGYRALHRWVEKRRGKPYYCEHCFKTDLPHRQYHWANKSHEYKREISDWIRLCSICHGKYDSQ